MRPASGWRVTSRGSDRLSLGPSPGNATRSTAARSPSNGSGWVTDPTRPVGTIAGPDIYLGNGEWQPLADTPN